MEKNITLGEQFNIIHQKAKELESLLKEDVCPDCNGEGFITVDDFNGDHVQYESKCECQIEK
jgi:hypothetical protein